MPARCTVTRARAHARELREDGRGGVRARRRSGRVATRPVHTRRSLDRAAAEKAAGPRFDEPTFATLAGAPGCVKVVVLPVPAGSKAGLSFAKNGCVGKVNPGGLADKKKIAPGWRCYDVNGKAVDTSAEINDALAAARKTNKPFKITFVAPGAAAKGGTAAKGAAAKGAAAAKAAAAPKVDKAAAAKEAAEAEVRRPRRCHACRHRRTARRPRPRRRPRRTRPRRPRRPRRRPPRRRSGRPRRRRPRPRPRRRPRQSGRRRWATARS